MADEKEGEPPIQEVTPLQSTASAELEESARITLASVANEDEEEYVEEFDSDYYSSDDIYKNGVTQKKFGANRSSFSSGMSGMSFETVDEIDFLKDKPSEMTGSRRLALKLMNKKWYNPHAGKNDIAIVARDGSVTALAPSIARAWAYFEHVTLNRHLVTGANKNAFEMTRWERFRYATTHSDDVFQMAKPGEMMRETRLYDWLATPHGQLGDWGIGFGIYFSTLRAITYILLIAGLISTFNIWYFSSAEYDDSNYDFDYMEHLLRGSAVCTDTEWVPCIDCNCTDPLQQWNKTDRCHEVFGGIGNESLTYALKNKCLEDNPASILVIGLVNYGVMMFLLPAIYIWLFFYLQKQAEGFDLDEQTAQDYSILIKRPPPNATDPSQWKEYFETTFPGVHVVAVTCNLDNDLLVKALVRRREVLRQMEVYLENGTNMSIDNLALIAAEEARNRGKYFAAFKALFIPGMPELVSKLGSLNTLIKGLAQLDYKCTNVFVSFEKEIDQRKVLAKLSVGRRYIRRNDPSPMGDPKYMFEGQVQRVVEATEPNSIRWQELNIRVSEKLKRTTLTSILTLGIIYVAAMAVTAAEAISPGFGAAFAIASMNLGFPQVAKFITDYEGHRNDSKLQTSLYIKIAAFRWVNTAIVTTYITPFTRTIMTEGIISQIAAIFFAEIVTTNVIQLTDVWGHIKRHILAPRAKTQDQMNRFFQGWDIELAERYTNMTKIMFLAFWYSSIFPGGLLFAAIALSVNYYTDRFSLMRSWQRSPRVGMEISNISLNYFFSTALFFLATMSSFYWSAFPFDNMCRTESSLNDKYAGEYIVDETKVVVDTNSSVYRFCNQDFILRPDGPAFPFIYREGEPGFGEWMTEEQQFLSQLFGWTSLGFICVVLLKFCWGIYKRIRSEFVSDYDFVEHDQGIDFHEVPAISGYVPQVRSNLFSYPLIVADCDGVGDRLFDWTDPDHDYGYYDITKDADHILIGSRTRAKNSFDRIEYWPPNSEKESLRRRPKRNSNVADRVTSVFNADFSSRTTR